MPRHNVPIKSLEFRNPNSFKIVRINFINEKIICSYKKNNDENNEIQMLIRKEASRFTTKENTYSQSRQN